MTFLKILQVSTLSIGLASPAMAQRDTIKAMILSALCKVDTTVVWTIQAEKRISISWIDCELGSIELNDKRLYNEVEAVLKENSKYKNASIIVLGREIKPNHKFSIDTSPYTEKFILKIDFNHKDGSSSTTIFYIYTEKRWLTKTSNVDANTRLNGNQK